VTTEGLDSLQAHYTRRRLDFYVAHKEEFDSAWLNPGAASRAILERLDQEFYDLRHSSPACMCKCSGKRHEGCEKWRQRVGGHGHERKGVLLDDVAREIGRTSPVHPPMPPAELLDLARLPRNLRSRGQQVAFLNGELAA
jgi:hypothetical protein